MIKKVKIQKVVKKLATDIKLTNPNKWLDLINLSCLKNPK